MANPLVVGEVYSLTIGTYFNDQSGLNRVHFIITSIAGTGTTDAAFVVAFDTVVAPLYKAVMHDAATYYGTKLYRRYPAPVYAPVIANGNQGPGTAGSVPLPTAICGMIRWGSNLKGRKGQGRIYVPFPATTALSAGEPSGAYVVQLGALGAAISSFDLVGSGANTAAVACVIAGKTDFATPVAISRVVTPQLWGTQHRRGDYGRLNQTPPFGI